MVWQLVFNPWFSVLINRMPRGFFPTLRGLRQGNPLSPSLFILGAEVLSRLLNQLQLHPRFCGFKVHRACPPITHLGFMDDILIFSSASALSLKLLMETLARYESVSGQRINATKSGFMVHSTMPRGRRAAIQRITGFSQKVFHKNRLLSPGGKIVLIKHLLSSTPLHLLAGVSPPKSILATVERLFANFLWGIDEGESKHHWICWKDLCAAKEEGGVGLRSMADVVNAFSVKL
ncbi:uncharacterized protein [Coffea arabica]|uniref:Reverse transcriptase domain-containing protein n=1 Tax=Coffea arabica TaxID=13443 RepID=A0ABM4UR21_COFAR